MRPSEQPYIDRHGHHPRDYALGTRTYRHLMEKHWNEHPDADKPEKWHGIHRAAHRFRPLTTEKDNQTP